MFHAIRTKISYRVSFVMILVVSTIFLGFGTLLSIEQYRSLEHELQERIAIISRLAEKSLPAPMWNVDDQTLQDFMEALFTDLSVVYAEYQIAGNSAIPSSERVHRRPEFADRTWQFFETTPQFVTQQVAISLRGSQLGLIRFAVSTSAIQENMRTRIVIIGLETLLMILAISLTALTITRRTILRPLSALQVSADQIMREQLDEQIDTSRPDELGRLAHSFANMRDAIRAKMIDLNRINEELIEEIMERRHIEAELKRHRDHLEDEVQARTAELSALNEELLSEIAERKQIENALQHAKVAAENANRAKSVFLANMSHELRTPLNGILGYTQMLARYATLSDDVKNSVTTIERCGHHLLAMIDDILDLAKVEAGKLEIRLTPFHLLSLLNDVQVMIAIKAERKGLRFDIVREGELPEYVEGDEHRLRQILLNLLGNAVKFTDHGSVTLRVGATPCGRPDNQAIGRLDDEQGIDSGEGQPRGAAPTIYALYFEIADTGIGIAPDDLVRLFMPFQQAGDMTRRAQGTGLGLAISRNLAELMGGTLNVTSKLGVGSVFRFEVALPEVAPNELRQSVNRRVIGVNDPAPTVLVVDDIADNRDVLVRFLTRWGCHTLEAANGQEALQIALREHPDAIITDLRMPEMDGGTLIQSIRRKPALAGTIIIASSASVYQENQQHSFEFGSDAFLPKPVQADRLSALLEQLGVAVWRYREETAPAAVPERQPCAAIPSELIEQMRQAVIIADIGQIERLIDTIQSIDAALAQTISQFAHNFEYEKILKIVTR